MVRWAGDEKRGWGMARPRFKPMPSGFLSGDLSVHLTTFPTEQRTDRKVSFVRQLRKRDSYGWGSRTCFKTQLKPMDSALCSSFFWGRVLIPFNSINQKRMPMCFLHFYWIFEKTCKEGLKATLEANVRSIWVGEAT